jgi:general secretion pathway protein I
LRNRTGIPSSRQPGFSLLEVMVAFTLMAIVLAVLIRVFSGGLQGIGIAEDYARAASIAESTLARVGADIALKEGSQSGDVEDRYRWTVTIKPHDIPLEPIPEGGFPSQPIQNLPVVLQEVAVTVTWSEYGRDRSYSLNTLRLGPRFA